MSERSVGTMQRRGYPGSTIGVAIMAVASVILMRFPVASAILAVVALVTVIRGRKAYKRHPELKGAALAGVSCVVAAISLIVVGLPTLTSFVIILITNLKSVLPS